MLLLVVLAFWLPGTVVGLALGLRSWTLGAAAPALTFGVIALGVPVLGHLGIRWGVWSVAAWALLLSTAALVGTRMLARPAPARDNAPDPGVSAWRSALVVALGVAGGMAVGVATFLGGVGRLDAVHQDWDAPYHGNLIRWIAETGNPLPSTLAPLANLPQGVPYFYPDAYHALLAPLLDQAGLTMPKLLNCAALVVVLTWPLAVAALGLAWRMPPLGAAIAALVSTWFGVFPYDSLWRGPLWPYVAGVALVPAVLALTRRALFPQPAAPLAGPVGVGVATAGLVGLHTSLAFVLAVYGGMLLVALLLRLEPVRWRAAARSLALTLAAPAGLVLPVFLPALASAGGVLAAEWPQLSTPRQAVLQAATFSAPDLDIQYGLAVPALAGLVLLVRRRRLVWVVGAYLFFAAMFVAGAAYVLPPLRALTSVFYTDVWRIAALLPLAGALAIGELGARLAELAGFAAARWRTVRRVPRRAPEPGTVARYATAAAFVAVLTTVTSGAAVDRNLHRLAASYGNGPTVSIGEEQAFAWLAPRVRPAERVVNDVADGGVWMYALAGVRPVNWTFYGALPGTDAQFLLDNLNRLDTDPRVRAVLETLNARYVLVGAGEVRPWLGPSVGMKDLADVVGLREVYRNSEAVVYEVREEAAEPDTRAQSPG
jgi:hypothetical protein